MFFTKFSLISPVAASFIVPSLACAQAPATNSPAVLEEMVVTATRFKTDPLKVPQMIQQGDAETISRTQARTVPEMLAETPGVMVQKTSNGQGSPFLRGFTGYRTLAMVDGVRYNNSIFREGPNEYWALLDPLSVSEYELVMGPGSVLYGSDAVGGTLNLLSKDSGFQWETAGKSFAHGSAFYRYHTSENSHLGRLEAQIGRGQQYGLHLGYSQREFGDVEAADLGIQPKTGYSQWAYDVRFDAKLADKWKLTVARQQSDQDDAWRTHATIHALPFAGSSKGSDLRRSLDHARSLTYARLEGSELEGAVDNVRLTLSHRDLDESQYRIRDNSKSERSSLDLSTWGVDLQLDSETPVGHLTYGVEYYRDSVDSARSDFAADGSLDQRRIQGPVGDDSTYDLAGIYLQDVIKLGERAELTLGGRYTRATADIGAYEDPLTKESASLDKSWDETTASARLSIDLDDKERVKLFAGASQAFRAPNLSDLSRLDIARSSEIETAAADLEPEKFLTWEIGLKARGERSAFSVGYFYTDISDLIVRTPTGRVIDELNEVTKSNGAEGYVHGFEVAGEYEFTKGWTLFGNAAWQEGEADSYPTSAREMERQPISRMLPFTGTLGLRWTSNSGGIWSELACTASEKADRLNAADIADTQRIPPGGTPGYTLLTLRAGWRVNDHLEVLASLENILDEAYRVHGSGSNEPGIGASLGVKVSF
jgi:hemoglobin/transferrin/lactoferrin receptor protein